MPEKLHWDRIQAGQKEIRAVIARDFSASRMNTTKWKEVAECLTDLPLRYRFKFVYEADAEFEISCFWYVVGDWLDTGPLGPFTSISVEWLEINPIEQIQKGLLTDAVVISHAEEIEKRLQSLFVPYHWENDKIKITGHVRKICEKK